MSLVYIGIGSNIGDAVGNCKKGIEEIGGIRGNKIVSLSSFYRTEPIGQIKQDWFINCVVKVETSLMPHPLLAALQGVEKKLGRNRNTGGGPRIIDIDILLFNGLIINEEGLNIPHPRMHERRFVLEPLSEIDENLIHPVIKKSVRRLLGEVGNIQRVEPL